MTWRTRSSRDETFLLFLIRNHKAIGPWEDPELPRGDFLIVFNKKPEGDWTLGGPGAPGRRLAARRLRSKPANGQPEGFPIVSGYAPAMRRVLFRAGLANTLRVPRARLRHASSPLQGGMRQDVRRTYMYIYIYIYAVSLFFLGGVRQDVRRIYIYIYIERERENMFRCS